MIDAGGDHPLAIILLASEGKNLLTWDRDCLVCLSTDCLKFLCVISFMQWQILFHLVLSSTLGLRLCYVSLILSSSLGYLNSRTAWNKTQCELGWELQGSSLLFLLESLCSAHGLSHNTSCSFGDGTWCCLCHDTRSLYHDLLSWWSDWKTFHVDPVFVFFCSGIWGVQLRPCHEDKNHYSDSGDSLTSLIFCLQKARISFGISSGQCSSKI